MPGKPQPKISLPEAVAIGMFLGILDAIDLIPLAGDVTDVAAAPLLLYYYMKHLNGIAYGASLILDAIPGIQEVPTRSIVWWGTIAFDHFAPKQVEEALEKLGEEAEGKEEGALSEGEEAPGEGIADADAGSAPGEESGRGQGGAGGGPEEEGAPQETAREKERGEKKEEENVQEPESEEAEEEKEEEQETADVMAGEEEIPWDQREKQEQFEGGMDNPAPREEDDDTDEEETRRRQRPHRSPHRAGDA